MEGKKGNIGLIVGMVLIVLLIGVSVFTYPKWGSKVSNMFSDTEQVAQEHIDTIIEPTYTVEDVVKMREAEREFRYLDSVYMNMPEIALIAILIKEGIDMSHTNIAKEYLINRKSYEDVQFGAQINDIYKHQQSEPDTIPKQAKTDIPIIQKE